MKFRRIDIHAHVNFPEYDADRDAVVSRALDDGTAIINVGVNGETSDSAVRLAGQYESGVYATVGLHPCDRESFDVERLRTLCRDPKVVGIGECGLEYYRLEGDVDAEIARQKEVFSAQIALAGESGKPLMLHVREGRKSGDASIPGKSAYGDALEMISAAGNVRGNVHFFAGSREVAGRFLDLGFTLSFTGVITFADEYADLVRYVPLDMIQAETDCPYVAPAPHRGARSEPSYVSFVVARIAEIKGLTLEKAEEALLENAKRLWGII